MIERHSLEADVAPLKLEAIDWAARLAGGLDDGERAAFDAWRTTSPAHADAYRRAAAFMDDLYALNVADDRSYAANVVPLNRPSNRMSRRAFVGGGIAASIAAGFVAMESPLGLWPSMSELMADERTGAGQRRTFSPTAGVAVELNSRSSVSRTSKGIKLVVGQIYVSTRRSEPFEINTALGSAIAQDGEFDVRAYGNELCLTCLKGRLSANLDGSPRTLAPGDAATYRKGEEIKTAQVDPQIATAWRRGLLIFKGTPLAEAVAEINRYYPGRLILNGDSAAARPVSGVFHVARIERALIQIQGLTRLRATRLPGGVVLLG